ncbi:MAG: DNA-processing protein DprA [bacterium]
MEPAKLKDIRILTIKDKDYPANLRFTFTPPKMLYVKGDLSDFDSVAIAVVGSRTPTAYGIKVTRELVGELSRNGVTVISGLARGIDTCAHKAALDAGGRTIAILGSGHYNIYPPENRALAEAICNSGAVISEFPLQAGPRRENFPRRNRLISGLSLGTIVVEAKQKSGSLITASFALEQGREVFAVPGNIYSKCSEGTNQLIKQGAKLVETIDDIIEEIDSFKTIFNKKQEEQICPSH